MILKFLHIVAIYMHMLHLHYFWVVKFCFVFTALNNSGVVLRALW